MTLINKREVTEDEKREIKNESLALLVYCVDSKH